MEGKQERDQDAAPQGSYPELPAGQGQQRQQPTQKETRPSGRLRQKLVLFY